MCSRKGFEKDRTVDGQIPAYAEGMFVSVYVGEVEKMDD